MKIIAKLINKATELIFPNNCILCNKIIPRCDLLCADDFLRLKFITDPKCQICCHPLSNADDVRVNFCVNCLAKKPQFSKLIAVFCYNSALKKIIASFKYHDNCHLADRLGLLLYQKIKDDLDKIDIITVVPLHKKRLQKRKFNQSVLLSRALIGHAKCASLSKKFIPDLLIKTKNTTPQVFLSHEARKANLSSAFMVKKKYYNLIEGKRILLIDDVVTTTTTVQKCAYQLNKGRVGEVVVLTVAKSVKGI